MTDNAIALLSDVLDGEPVDEHAVAAVLREHEGVALLVDLVLLRAATNSPSVAPVGVGAGPDPSPKTWWTRRIALLALAATVLLVTGTTFWQAGREPALGGPEPPAASQVIRFVHGENWGFVHGR
jgi:hypothetical protein